MVLQENDRRRHADRMGAFASRQLESIDLIWNSTSRQGWPLTWKDPPAPASRASGLRCALSHQSIEHLTLSYVQPESIAKPCKGHYPNEARLGLQGY